MHLGYSSNNWAPVVGAPVGVTSVKDLFYTTSGWSLDSLASTAAAGYSGVEVFDGDLLGYHDRPDELTTALRENSLALVSVYTGANFIFGDIVDEEMAKIQKAASLAATFGARHLVIGGGAKRTSGPADGDFDRLAAGLGRAADIASAEGLHASYHPHLGTLVETPEALERIMSLSEIDLCPDTAHLAGGGGDPGEQIRRYGARVAHVHFKDRDPQTGAFVPLGDGDLDFADIVAALREVGYDDWIMTELEYYEGDLEELALRSRVDVEELLGEEPE